MRKAELFLLRDKVNSKVQNAQIKIILTHCDASKNWTRFLLFF